MRAVIQRVSAAKVSVEQQIVGSINKGLLILLGVAQIDNKADADYLVEKIINLRIFSDENNKMNLSLLDIKADLLVVSQFTLFGDCRRGRRPSYSDAALPKQAEELYIYFVNQAILTGINVQTGKFQAMMDVELINDGPVTILLDSKKAF
ncbi:MAG: D-tyrosyl-tRNA(Tyr) deacylase [Blastocatellia bacterium]|nr:D-tyrosyl-tRNA(Tyr) deacylase [Blastocatellia bacterium]MBL8193645.1 D-tyrosyl-tRNA(Tyr) deacylase [Blastocatellia bacterium]MBN8723753.1 D-tyrosyl-tRNA(Tyr) deacylase [Acidobacteriota bacterium]